VEDAIPTTDIKSEATDTSIAASAVPVNPGLSSIQQIAPRQNSSVENISTDSTLHFESVSLIPVLNTGEIRGRWLKPNLMTGAGEVPDEDRMATSQDLSPFCNLTPVKNSTPVSFHHSFIQCNFRESRSSKLWQTAPSSWDFGKATLPVASRWSLTP
jgi:hypothetical protein